jgi:hypothetical protein
LKRFVLHIAPILLFISYFIVRVLKKQSGINLPSFFKNYYTDLIFIPVALGIGYLVVKLLKRPKEVHMPLGLIIFQVIFNSVVFEYYLPNYATNAEAYTADYWDIVMYVLGGLLFWTWCRMIESKN